MSAKYDENRITYFAITDSRNKRIPFGIKAKDRTKHVYTIGKSGMGKSTMLENMAIQDIRNGEGFAFIDPHGSTVEKFLDYIPEERIKDVLYFAPFDLDNPVSFNVLEDVGVDKRHLVVSGLMSAFKKIWVDAWSARMEYILNNILLALLEYPDATLLGVNRMLADKDFRNKVVANVTDPAVRAFWVDEYAKYTERFAAEAAPAIQNKIGQFVSNPLIRNIIGQPKSNFSIREMMDNQKIILINLSKGKVGEANANLLGSMFITKIYLAAMSRADVTYEQMKELPNFYLYVDEFQSFANESFANILSEARKYKLNLTIAHQYIEQMSEEVRAAVFGNVGTMITFRIGAYDAGIFEKEFSPEFTAEDMVNLGSYQIYLKLMIDNVTSKPFSATALPPISPPQFSYHEQIIHYTRQHFAKPRYEVEEGIKEWHQSDRGLKDNKDTKGKQENSDKIWQRQNGDTGNNRSNNPKPYQQNLNNSKEVLGQQKDFKERNFPPKGSIQKQEKVQPFKTAFKSIGISKEEQKERENDLRKAISSAYGTRSSETFAEDKNNETPSVDVRSGEEVVNLHFASIPKVEKTNDVEEIRDMEALQKLPKDPRSINTKKEASATNLAGLREAVTFVAPNDTNKIRQNFTVKDSKDEIEKNKLLETDNSTEIPEEVLKKMLQVDDDHERKS